MTSEQARAWGTVGAYKRLSTEDPKAMTLPARTARERNRLAKVDAVARERGEYPLSEAERERRAGALLNEEMARVRAARLKKRRGKAGA